MKALLMSRFKHDKGLMEQNLEQIRCGKLHDFYFKCGKLTHLIGQCTKLSFKLVTLGNRLNVQMYGAWLHAEKKLIVPFIMQQLGTRRDFLMNRRQSTKVFESLVGRHD